MLDESVTNRNVRSLITRPDLQGSGYQVRMCVTKLFTTYLYRCLSGFVSTSIVSMGNTA